MENKMRCTPFISYVYLPRKWVYFLFIALKRLVAF